MAARSSLLRRIAALAALAPRLVRLAHHDYPDGLLAMSDGGASRAWRVPARPRRLLLVAGEASGDLHGADLVRALRASVPDLEVFGVGGERLREAGMETVAAVGQGATMGRKAAGGRRALWHAYRTLARRLRADPPDLCVLIDFPEFHLRLARGRKRAGVPVLCHIARWGWAWRRGGVGRAGRRAAGRGGAVTSAE